VADHTAVDPRFGTLEDFDALVRKAHRLGIRVILDLVLNHTSDRHPWFLESRGSLGSRRRDWYIWRDPRPGGKPPNNWQASFGGKAWTLDPRTGQYYYHMFLPRQPDLNWRNPEVRKAQLDVVRFWLERGVDGFRLDVFNAYFKDALFRDNPPKPGLRGFDRQRHIHDRDQPEMMSLLGDLRSLLDGYHERYAVGETFGGTAERAAGYVGTGLLHAAFSFDFTPSEIAFPWNPAWLLGRVQSRETLFNAERWPTTVMSNHDIPRAASRYARDSRDAQSKLAMALLLTLRGTPFMYYGEEIGMRDIRLRRSQIMDPPGKRYWPLYKGRDGCRSPMQWDGTEHAGFSSGRPWLPLHPDHVRRNVAMQSSDPESMLSFTRKLIGLRKELPALRRGGFVPLYAPRGALAYLRKTEAQAVLVVLNFRGRKTAMRFEPPLEPWRPLFSTAHRDDGFERTLVLGPYEIRMFCSPSAS
jgi:alpha-glucosidase